MAGEGQQTAAERGAELQNHEAAGESTQARRQRHTVPEEGTQSQQAPGREGDWGPEAFWGDNFLRSHLLHRCMHLSKHLKSITPGE